jgi:hypothetical protein
VTELIYRKQLRPVLTEGAEAMDGSGRFYNNQPTPQTDCCAVEVRRHSLAG